MSDENKTRRRPTKFILCVMDKGVMEANDTCYTVIETPDHVTDVATARKWLKEEAHDQRAFYALRVLNDGKPIQLVKKENWSFA